MDIQVLLNKINSLAQGENNVLIAIDGRCGSGKTTLGNRLHQLTDCNLFHMDNFYLRPEQRTPERYAQPGGNVDYERFLEEVITPVLNSVEFSYRPFDIKIWDLGDKINILPKKINIIEGSYSLHPILSEYYNIKIFLDISKEEQLSRIIKRNGEQWAKDFKDKWIPLEELYFSAYRVDELCDFVWNTDNIALGE